MSRSLALLHLSLLLLLKESSCVGPITLKVNEPQQYTIQPLKNYTIVVNPTSSGNYSAFTVQAHTQLYNITLRNAMSNCTIARLCSTTGTNIGFVQVPVTEGLLYNFEASIRSCGVNSSSCAGVANVSVLFAVVGIGAGEPIPGGCAQTSALEYEAAITATYDSSSTTVYFQDSDVGFLPVWNPAIPACDSSLRPMQQLEYHVYRQCVSVGDFGEESMLSAIRTMLDPVTAKSQEYAKLKYSDPKRVVFDSISGRGIVYNVVVRDTSSGMTSPYIPGMTYSCELASGDCKVTIPVSSYILGPLLGLVGLFLCFLAQRFFHLEIIILSALIAFFYSFLAVSATTNFSYNVLIGSSIGLALLISLLKFIFWFFTGYVYLFVITFGLNMGGLISATLFFTPLGSLITLLELNYIYILCFLCIAVLCIVPLVAFPVLLNTVATSVIGSYAVVFCISMFKYNQLQDILVRIVKNAAIPGFLNAHSGCTFDTTDIICSCVWIVLALSGIIVQLVIHHVRKRRFKKKQDPYRPKRFSGFPTISLFRRIVRRRQYQQINYYNSHRVRGSVAKRRHDNSSRPLLSPGRHDVPRSYGTH